MTRLEVEISALEKRYLFAMHVRTAHMVRMQVIMRAHPPSNTAPREAYDRLLGLVAWIDLFTPVIGAHLVALQELRKWQRRGQAQEEKEIRAERAATIAARSVDQSDRAEAAAQRADARRRWREAAAQRADASLDATTRRRWRDWKSEPIDDELAAPIVSVSKDESAAHVLSNEIERRALARLSWAPWARRERYRSRRYEGYSRTR